MAKLSAIITGDRELTRALNNIGGRKAMAVHNKALRRAAYVVLAWAKNIVPTRSGAWKRSLVVRVARRSRKGPRFLVTERFTINRASKARESLFYVPFQELGYKATGRPRAVNSLNADGELDDLSKPFKNERFNRMFMTDWNEDSFVSERFGKVSDAGKSWARYKAHARLTHKVSTYRGGKFLVAQLDRSVKKRGR